MATSASKAAPKADANPAQPQKSRSGKTLFLVLGALLLLGAGAGGAWYYFEHAAANAGVALKKEAPKPPVFLVMDTFTVNLHPEDGNQYLQVGMTLQLADPAQTELLNQYMPQVRSRLLLLLSNKKASEVLTAEGKEKLAKEIIAQVKRPFAAGGPHPEVSNVFFTSFVVQ